MCLNGKVFFYLYDKNIVMFFFPRRQIQFIRTSANAKRKREFLAIRFINRQYKEKYFSKKSAHVKVDDF
jgi:hypothetical protein